MNVGQEKGHNRDREEEREGGQLTQKSGNTERMVLC